jgi:hypothetical protein
MPSTQDGLTDALKNDELNRSLGMRVNRKFVPNLIA